jgi:uncharacterized membrane protein (UPF0127 family)
LRPYLALAAATLLVACSSGADTGGGAATTQASTATATASTSVPPPGDPTTTLAPPVSAPGDGQPVGFTTVAARITAADGEVCEVCLWLADTAEERARGLMDVTTLGAADGMVFVFEEQTFGAFYMFDTPTPLSIAWFDEAGPLVGTADMAPCLDTPAGECPLYSPGAPYRYALEVFAGGLEEIGVGPGATFELVPGTEADRCPAAASS